MRVHVYVSLIVWLCPCLCVHVCVCVWLCVSLFCSCDFCARRRGFLLVLFQVRRFLSKLMCFSVVRVAAGFRSGTCCRVRVGPQVGCLLVCVVVCFCYFCASRRGFLLVLLQVRKFLSELMCFSVVRLAVGSSPRINGNVFTFFVHAFDRERHVAFVLV